MMVHERFYRQIRKENCRPLCDFMCIILPEAGVTNKREKRPFSLLGILSDIVVVFKEIISNTVLKKVCLYNST